MAKVVKMVTYFKQIWTKMVLFLSIDIPECNEPGQDNLIQAC